MTDCEIDGVSVMIKSFRLSQTGGISSRACTLPGMRLGASLF